MLDDSLHVNNDRAFLLLILILREMLKGVLKKNNTMGRRGKKINSRVEGFRRKKRGWTSIEGKYKVYEGRERENLK
jgi:hypothetical protein